MNRHTENQLDLLYKSARAGIVADVVVASAIAAMLWSHTPPLFLPIWFVAVCLGVLARTALVRRYQRTSLTRRCLRRWQASYSLASVYAGAIWGSLGLFSTLSLDSSYQLLITFVLLGIAVHALARKCVFLPVYLDFLLPMLLPLMLGFLMQANAPGTWMAILLAMLIGAFFQCARQINRIIVSGMELSLEKDGLVSRLMTAQEDERKRIAAELHDGIGQSLSGIKYSLENEVKKLNQRQVHGETLQSLDATAQRIQEAIGELRDIAMGLRPAMLEDLGILSTMDWFCRKYHSAHPQVNVSKRYAVEEREIPQELKVLIYRIVQEAFNNIAKHASADQVTLALEKRETAVRLLVKDNGQGFDIGSAKPETSFGLTSMRERAESRAGEFNLTSAIGLGTTVEVSWPLAELGKLSHG
ncbi:MAG: sensor histidine kinase [Gammaproteobacteria bacterium]|nr:sensor histidine kinase [Gammaproteobacteria bacterium]